MNVSEELKAGIKEAVESGYLEMKVDDTVSSVIAILEEHKINPTDINGKKLVPVKYIGKRDFYSDGNFDTGDWRQGDTKLVPAATSAKMLEHASVYVLGEREESVDVVEDSAVDKEKKEEEEKLLEARGLVEKMTRKAAVDKFVYDNYNGLAIPEEFDTLPKKKEFALMQVDRYGVV